MREIYSVLADVNFVFERGGNVDSSVGNDEDFVIRRHIHDEYVTDATSCSQTAVARHNGRHQLIRVQAAFHQDLRFAFANLTDSGCGGRVTMWNVDDFEISEIDSVCCLHLCYLRSLSD